MAFAAISWFPAHDRSRAAQVGALPRILSGGPGLRSDNVCGQDRCRT